MKTIRTEAEELLLSKLREPHKEQDHPACFEAEVLEERIRELISGDTIELHRDVLAEIWGMAFQAYAHRGIAPNEITRNPATVPLIAFVLLMLDRYRDNISAHNTLTSTKVRKALADAMFLVRPKEGRPGPLTIRQKTVALNVYRTAHYEAILRGMPREDAYKRGLACVYQRVLSEAEETESQVEKSRAHIKRVLKRAGLT